MFSHLFLTALQGSITRDVEYLADTQMVNVGDVGYAQISSSPTPFKCNMGSMKATRWLASLPVDVGSLRGHSLAGLSLSRSLVHSLPPC